VLQRLPSVAARRSDDDDDDEEEEEEEVEAEAGRVPCCVQKAATPAREGGIAYGTFFEPKVCAKKKAAPVSNGGLDCGVQDPDLGD
jgi:hypothetical protein